MDVYAPSLHGYFGEIIQNKNRRTINDFLLGECKVKDILQEIAPISQFSDMGSLPGKIIGCFASPKREDILKIDGVKEDKNRMNSLKRFIHFREELDEKNDIDYLILDTSPGIFSITRALLSVSDIGIFILRTGEIDNTGLRNLADYIQAVNKEHKNNAYYLVINMFSGYCISDTQSLKPEDTCTSKANCSLPPVNKDLTTRILNMEEYNNPMTFVPCYCDIQFAQREFLTVLGYPEHPFSQKINELNNLINV